MAGGILFHGEDHELVVKQMQSRAMEILGVDSLEALMKHGDYQEVQPTSKSYLYSMDVIHSVVEESALPPFRGKKRIIALLAVDRMQKVHANALLKTLEDAPESFVLLLTTICYDDIIKTILSRVQKEHIAGGGEYPDYSPQIKELFSLLASKKYDAFFKEIIELDKSMTENVELSEKNLRVFLEDFMSVFIAKEKAPHLISAKASRIEVLIDASLRSFHGNIRIKHVLENLFLETQQQNCSM